MQRANQLLQPQGSDVGCHRLTTCGAASHHCHPPAARILLCALNHMCVAVAYTGN
jgi:hypothetical protein